MPTASSSLAFLTWAESFSPLSSPFQMFQKLSDHITVHENKLNTFVLDLESGE